MTAPDDDLLDGTTIPWDHISGPKPPQHVTQLPRPGHAGDHR